MENIKNKINWTKLWLYISKPGYVLHRYSVIIEGTNYAQMALITLLSFWVVLQTLCNNWPYQSSGEVFISFIMVVLTIGILSAIVKFTCSYIFAIITFITEPFSNVYEKCNDKLKYEDLKDSEYEYEKRATSLGNGPKAEVGIKYFIEQEKNNKQGVYNAKYIGMN